MTPKEPEPTAVFLMCFVAAALSSCASAPVVVMRQRPACSTGPAQADAAKPFDVSQAHGALLRAAQTASECSLDAAKNSGRVLVTFGPAGCVAKMKLELKGPELGPADVECMANAFLAARVDAFSGNAVNIAKTLTASL